MLPKTAATAIAPGKPKGKLKGKSPKPAAPAGAPAEAQAGLLKAGASKQLKGMS